MLLLAAALALSAQGPVAISVDEAGGKQIRIEARDLDLTTTAGLNRLERRIETATRRACPGSDSVDLRARRAAQNCRRQVAQDAGRARDMLVARAAENRRQLARSGEELRRSFER